MAERFAVGDSVFVQAGGRTRGPFKVAKQHKNGNVVLEGDIWAGDGSPNLQQYRSSGMATGDGRGFLRHDTPGVRSDINLQRLKARAREALRIADVENWDADRLERLLAVLSESPALSHSGSRDRG